jgi:hypothetical protein
LLPDPDCLIRTPDTDITFKINIVNMMGAIIPLVLLTTKVKQFRKRFLP